MVYLYALWKALIHVTLFEASMLEIYDRSGSDNGLLAHATRAGLRRLEIRSRAMASVLQPLPLTWLSFILNLVYCRSISPIWDRIYLTIVSHTRLLGRLNRSCESCPLPSPYSERTASRYDLNVTYGPTPSIGKSLFSCINNALAPWSIRGSSKCYATG